MNSRGRDLSIILGYLLLTILAGAAFAPVLFKLGATTVGIIDQFRLGGRPFGWLRKVAAESDFNRYFNRSVLIAALFGLVPTLKLLNMRWRDLGLRRDPHRLRHLGIGFLLAAGLLFQMGACLALAGLFGIKSRMEWLPALQTAAITAASVAVLEELVFRGMLTGLLQRSLGKWPTLLAVASLFAILHFVQPPPDLAIPPESVTATSGFRLAGIIFSGFADPETLAAEFATLLVVGLLLGYARMRTDSLWLPVGLHAGWVFGVFAFRGILYSSDAVKSGACLPWIGDNLKTGLLPLAALLLTGCLLAWWLRATLPSPPSGSRSVPN